jgi:hypothetical protein
MSRPAHAHASPSRAAGASPSRAAAAATPRPDWQATPCGRRGVLRLVAAGVQSFLIEPAEQPERAEASHEPPPPPQRPVIAVFGLARRCGATVVARALAAELAGRDPAGTAAVASGAAAGGIPIATSAAGRLADWLGDVPRARPTAVGRLCLVEGADPSALAEVAREHAPLVLDGGTGPLDGAPAAVADRVLLVTTPRAEAALARVAADCVLRAGAEPEVVVNRCPLAAPAPFPSVPLPESRMGAQLALGGRLARGELGRAIAALADRCLEMT